MCNGNFITGPYWNDQCVMVTLLQGHIGMVIDFEKLKFGKFMKYKNWFLDIYFADAVYKLRLTKQGR